MNGEYYILHPVRLLIVMIVLFSLASLPGPIASKFHLPSLRLARANLAPSEAWYPAGPAMNAAQMVIYSSEVAELAAIQQANPLIDLTDTPILPINRDFFSSGSAYYVSPAVYPTFFGIEFMLANNFWGCAFSLGNNATSFPGSSNCGRQIRQGIAHLVDKNSFTNNEPDIAGQSTPIDNPVLPNNGGLPTPTPSLPAPNPCNWDLNFTQTGSNCHVGAPGGTAFHLAAATGVNFAWQPALGSPDFCAAATHFISASLAIGKDPTTCILTSINATVTAHTVNFFVRTDRNALTQLGDSVSQEICALFGQGFVTGCARYLTVTHGPIGAFPGFATSINSVNLSWGMYTAGEAGGGIGNVFNRPWTPIRDPFDSALYFGFNSQFVSGIPSVFGVRSIEPPCSKNSVGSYIASNYMYMCVPPYDSISSLMEYAGCIGASGDPRPGQTSPSFANCSGQPVSGTCTATSGCSAVSAGYQTEDMFGQGAYTIPVWVSNSKFVYLSNWSRVISGSGGIANYFSLLNAYSASAAQPLTIRQGFSQTTRSMSPYVASTFGDLMMLASIYDSLSAVNPVSDTQSLDWMIVSSQTLNNGQLTYTPPSGTVATFRLTLRGDLFFQDGRKVSSWDVAFSYLSLLATGAFQSGSASVMTGITVWSSTQFDINVNAVGPFTQLYLTSLTILPGSSWSGAGSFVWRDAVSTCSTAGAACFPAQYTLQTPIITGSPPTCNNTCLNGTTTPATTCALGGCSGFKASLLNVDPTKITANYDPLANGILIGSGPWQCRSSTGVVGTGCSDSGKQNPLVSYTLQRFGIGTIPGAGISDHFFRSSGNLALWVWSQDNGDFTHDFINFTVVAACFGIATGGCAHFAHGIGGTGGAGIGSVQIGIVNRFLGVNWVSPLVWTTSPPVGIGAFPPVLYEGSVTLNPCSIDPVNGYDC